MTPRKFKILIATFSYGGNGGMKSEHPDVRDWLIKSIPYLKSRPDVESVLHTELADTPITMTRNRAVLTARDAGADFLLMLDSDMAPDLYLGRDPSAKPFLETSLDYCVERYERGPHVVFSPYCGPPPVENIYVFRWRNSESDTPNDEAKLEQFTRAEAAERAGFEAVAAAPTGLILYDMRAFELIEPRQQGDKHWFAYEWTDIYGSGKASTEDVQNTRDISLAGIVKYGYNPVICNWDSWSGHWKPKCVGKPQVFTADAVGNSLRRVVEEGRLPRDEKLTFVNFDSKPLPVEAKRQYMDKWMPPLHNTEPVRDMLERQRLEKHKRDVLSWVEKHSRHVTPANPSMAYETDGNADLYEKQQAEFTAHHSLPSSITKRDALELMNSTDKRGESLTQAIGHGFYVYDSNTDTYERAKPCPLPTEQTDASAPCAASPSY